jgi:hypothetical protein
VTVVLPDGQRIHIPPAQSSSAQHASLLPSAVARRYSTLPRRTLREPVITRLIGLCLLILATWPAGADVRAEGLSVSRLITIQAEPLDLGERERVPPSAPAFAAGRADADEPKLLATPTARPESIPARCTPEITRSRPLCAPLSHRPCAAPPTGPPAG